MCGRCLIHSYSSYIYTYNWISNKNLLRSLTGEVTDAQAKQIIDQYDQDLEATLQRLDNAKTRQLSDLEKKLAERRAKKERDLRSKHEQEATQAGLPPPPPGIN